MSSRVPVAAVSEFNEGTVRVVNAGQKAVAIFRIEGKFHAIWDFCPHRGGPLSEGEREGTIVSCPWHAGKFDLATGKPVSGPTSKPLVIFRVIVENDQVIVEIP